MTKRILVPIAPGTEEMEAVTIIDILVRAGYQVVVASADFDGKLTMTASRGVMLTAECKLVDVADDEFDAVVLAGGVGGAENFRDSTLLVEIIKQQNTMAVWWPRSAHLRPLCCNTTICFRVH